jgi:hypothetical protein
MLRCSFKGTNTTKVCVQLIFVLFNLYFIHLIRLCIFIEFWCKQCPLNQRQKWQVIAERLHGEALTRDDASNGSFVPFMKLECFGAIHMSFTFGRA